MVKRLSAMRESWVRSLGWEDPLEKERAAHSSALAWKIPWTEEPGRLHTVHGVAKSRTRLSDFISLFLVSGLEYPPTIEAQIADKNQIKSNPLDSQ